MRWWSLACVLRSLAKESGRHGMRKIGLPGPLHRLLCLHGRVGGNRDWVVLRTWRWWRIIKNWLACFFSFSFWIIGAFQRINPNTCLRNLLYFVVILCVQACFILWVWVWVRLPIIAYYWISGCSVLSIKIKHSTEKHLFCDVPSQSVCWAVSRTDWSCLCALLWHMLIIESPTHA